VPVVGSVVAWQWLGGGGYRLSTCHELVCQCHPRTSFTSPTCAKASTLLENLKVYRYPCTLAGGNRNVFVDGRQRCTAPQCIYRTHSHLRLPCLLASEPTLSIIPGGGSHTDLLEAVMIVQRRHAIGSPSQIGLTCWARPTICDVRQPRGPPLVPSSCICAATLYKTPLINAPTTAQYPYQPRLPDDNRFPSSLHIRVPTVYPWFA
jgi:hypothetical protein